MWICSSQVTARPIMPNATAAGMRRRLKLGIASKNPRKNTIAGARMYEVLMRCAEN